MAGGAARGSGGGEAGEAEGGEAEEPVRKKSLKNPNVKTDFLPDAERDEKQQDLREKYTQEWKDSQDKVCGVRVRALATVVLCTYPINLSPPHPSTRSLTHTPLAVCVRCISQCAFHSTDCHIPYTP